MTKSTLLIAVLLSGLACAEPPRGDRRAAEPVATSGASGDDASRADAERELSEWRGRIDELDRELIALLNRRAGYVLELAPLKRRIGVQVQDSEREQQVRRNLKAANAGPLPDDSVVQIYEAIMATMRELQSRD